MSNLTKCIYRQRRRLIVVSVLSALAGFILFLDDPRLIEGFPVGFLAGVGFGSAAALGTLLIALVQPKYRFSCEILALTFVLYAAVAATTPQARFDQAPIPVLIMILFIIAAQTLYHLVYGSWSDQLLHQKLHVDRATAVSAADQDVLWHSFFPDPQALDSFVDGQVVSMDYLDEQQDTLHLIKDYGAGMYQERILHFVQVKHGWSFRYKYEILGIDRPENTPAPTYTLVLEPRGHDTAVHIRWENHDFPARKALMRWIDDWPGRKLDAAMARAETMEELEPAYA